MLLPVIILSSPLVSSRCVSSYLIQITVTRPQLQPSIQSVAVVSFNRVIFFLHYISQPDLLALFSSNIQFIPLELLATSVALEFQLIVVVGADCRRCRPIIGLHCWWWSSLSSSWRRLSCPCRVSSVQMWPPAAAGSLFHLFRIRRLFD